MSNLCFDVGKRGKWSSGWVVDWVSRWVGVEGYRWKMRDFGSGKRGKRERRREKKRKWGPIERRKSLKERNGGNNLNLNWLELTRTGPRKEKNVF